MIGIYKITNPKGNVYIGQSIDIEGRFSSYKKMKNCKNQIRLLRSFKKYGVDSHKFEIIEECDILILNERERYWQDFYNVIDINGLNCKLTYTNSKSGKLSDETVNKIKKWRITQLRMPHSEETRKKMSNSHRGKTLSDDHKQKLKAPKSEEHKQKLRGPRPHYKIPKEKIQCTVCGKHGAPGSMRRFHFDNCGIKQHNKKIECPHCKKLTDGANAKRWHFDNCKHKKC